MELTKEDRLNLIRVLSMTKFWELLPIELPDSEIGLDRKRWEDLLQKLIDNNYELKE